MYTERFFVIAVFPSLRMFCICVGSRSRADVLKISFEVGSLLALFDSIQGRSHSEMLTRVEGSLWHPILELHAGFYGVFCISILMYSSPRSCLFAVFGAAVGSEHHSRGNPKTTVSSSGRGEEECHRIPR